MKRIFFVSWGADSRHLFDCCVFDKLKDAKTKYKTVEPAKKLHSLDFEKYSVGENERIIHEVIQ